MFENIDVVKFYILFVDYLVIGMNVIYNSFGSYGFIKLYGFKYFRFERLLIWFFRYFILIKF